MALDREAAERAVGRLADELGMELLACAAGIVRVAGVEMARALRVITVQRGVDPRDFVLFAFGGAGPLHAVAVAQELGIRRVLCARAAGVLSALGLVISPRRRDAQRSVLMSGEALAPDAIAAVASELGEQARRALGDAGAPLRAVYELRYVGQSFELAVEGEMQPQLQALRAGFEDLHEERYGYRDGDADLELVTVRVSAISPGPEIELTAGGEEAGCDRSERSAWFDGEQLALEVLRGIPSPGTQLTGPAVVELPEATVLVAPGWSAEVNDTGTVVLTKADDEPA